MAAHQMPFKCRWVLSMLGIEPCVVSKEHVAITDVGGWVGGWVGTFQGGHFLPGTVCRDGACVSVCLVVMCMHACMCGLVEQRQHVHV